MSPQRSDQEVGKFKSDTLSLSKGQSGALSLPEVSKVKNSNHTQVQISHAKPHKEQRRQATRLKRAHRNPARPIIKFSNYQISLLSHTNCERCYSRSQVALAFCTTRAQVDGIKRSGATACQQSPGITRFGTDIKTITAAERIAQ